MRDLSKGFTEKIHWGIHKTPMRLCFEISAGTLAGEHEEEHVQQLSIPRAATSPETCTPRAGKERLGQAQPYAAPRLQTPILLTARDEKDSLSEIIKAPYDSAT